MKINSLAKQLLAILFLLILVAGCTRHQHREIVYDQNSWKTMIPDSCLSFFDGCNNCRRSSSSAVAACTRKACIKYEKPVCLDEAR